MKIETGYYIQLKELYPLIGNANKEINDKKIGNFMRCNIMKFKQSKLMHIGMTLGAGLVILIGLYADIFSTGSALLDMMGSGGSDTDAE